MVDIFINVIFVCVFSHHGSQSWITFLDMLVHVSELFGVVFGFCNANNITVNAAAAYDG